MSQMSQPSFVVDRSRLPRIFMGHDLHELDIGESFTFRRAANPREDEIVRHFVVETRFNGLDPKAPNLRASLYSKLDTEQGWPWTRLATTFGYAWVDMKLESKLHIEERRLLPRPILSHNRERRPMEELLSRITEARTRHPVTAVVQGHAGTSNAALVQTPPQQPSQPQPTQRSSVTTQSVWSDTSSPSESKLEKTSNISSAVARDDYTARSSHTRPAQRLLPHTVPGSSQTRNTFSRTGLVVQTGADRDSQRSRIQEEPSEASWRSNHSVYATPPTQLSRPSHDPTSPGSVSTAIVDVAHRSSTTRSPLDTADRTRTITSQPQSGEDDLPSYLETLTLTEASGRRGWPDQQRTRGGVRSPPMTLGGQSPPNPTPGPSYTAGQQQLQSPSLQAFPARRASSPPNSPTPPLMDWLDALEVKWTATAKEVAELNKERRDIRWKLLGTDRAVVPEPFFSAEVRRLRTTEDIISELEADREVATNAAMSHLEDVTDVEAEREFHTRMEEFHQAIHRCQQRLDELHRRQMPSSGLDHHARAELLEEAVGLYDVAEDMHFLRESCIHERAVALQDKLDSRTREDE